MKKIRTIGTCLLSGMMAFSLFLPSLTTVQAEGQAQEAALTLQISDGSNGVVLLDDDYATYEFYNEPASITISSDTAFSSLYLEWYQVPEEWTLNENGKETTEGKNGYLHEYAALAQPETEVTMNLPAGAQIANIHAYTAGTLPDDVQVWETMDGPADILAFSTHADDEVLWLGPALATYGGEQGYRTQVVYMTHYWSGVNGDHRREHEKLDGLWALGLHYYPENGSFEDEYADNPEQAEQIYSKDEVEDWTTEMIRKYQPQVVITQGFNGEYGHGAHILLANSVASGVDHAGEETFHSDSASQYGTWETRKAYFHLYDQNQITLDLHQPLSKFNGRDAVQVAQDAYKKHVTQQWTWFYVSDDPNDVNADKVNCSLFGLYKTSVGADTGNDMMEHITSYAEQEASAKASAEAEEKKEEEQTESSGPASSTPKQVRLIRVMTVAGIYVVLVILSLIVQRMRGKKRRNERRRRFDDEDDE
jgi:LmbE family N-acetylglucosaminyl deacetylase